MTKFSFRNDISRIENLLNDGYEIKELINPNLISLALDETNGTEFIYKVIDVKESTYEDLDFYTEHPAFIDYTVYSFDPENIIILKFDSSINEAYRNINNESNESNESDEVGDKVVELMNYVNSEEFINQHDESQVESDVTPEPIPVQSTMVPKLKIRKPLKVKS